MKIKNISIRNKFLGLIKHSPGGAGGDAMKFLELRLSGVCASLQRAEPTPTAPDISPVGKHVSVTSELDAITLASVFFMFADGWR